MLAAEQDTTVQELIRDGLNLMFQKHGKPPRLLSGSGVVMRVVPPAGIWCGGRDASSQPACARSLRHYGCT